MAPFSADDLSQHAASLRMLARDLLRDEALADDAVQQACVTALTRPPTGPVALGAWLRAVVRSCAVDLWRAEHRRRQRERSAVLPESSDPRDAAEKLELQEDIVAAVRWLDEPYRTAVWLRYYEHRTPKAIALALGEPVKTVKTRLWRALQLLRQKLDHRYGDRRAWFAALVPLAQAANAVRGVAGIAGGGLLMQGQKLLLAGVVLLVAIAGTALAWPRDPAAVEPAPGPTIAGAELPLRTESPAAEAPSPREQVTAPTSAAPYGSLVVRVQWHDHTPAPGVAVDCQLGGELQLDRNELRLVADANGIARASRVHAGPVRLMSDRGGYVDTTVGSGEVRDLDFVLPRGLDVSGAVVDERQRPVAGAMVVLVSPRAGWLGGRVVAVSDDAGAFAARAVDPTWSLGARAATYAPSHLVDLEDVAKAPDAGSVQLQLQLLSPGATVAGKVVDENREAVAGATVVLGRGAGGHYELSRTRESWSPQVVESGADGTFRCEGVEPGLQPIVARAEGCTRATADVQCVAGETVSVTLTVSRGVTVAGTVRDEAGLVVADAEVMVLGRPIVDMPVEFAMRDDRSELKRPRTRSDSQGQFVLRGAQPGELHLVAAKRTRGAAMDFGRFDGVCYQSLMGQLGDHLTWNPVLVAGKTMRVRIVDADGKPARIGHALTARAEQPAGLASVLSVFGEEDPLGLHVFSNCADVPYTVYTRVRTLGQATRWVWVRGAVPGGPDVELRLPPIPREQPHGEVVGRIVDEGHRFGGQPMSVSLCTLGTWRDVEMQGDHFLASKVPPGSYFLWVKAGNDPVLVTPSFEVHPAEKRNLGDVPTQPGATVRVALKLPAGAAVEHPAAELDEGYSWRRLQWDGTHLVGENVSVGRHRLELQIAGWHAKGREFELTAGQDLAIQLDVVPATLRRFQFTMPLPDEWQSCTFALRDGANNLVSANAATAIGVGLDPHVWWGHQPFGMFTLEAVLDGKLHSWPVDLGEPGPDEPLRFSLR